MQLLRWLRGPSEPARRPPDADDDKYHKDRSHAYFHPPPTKQVFTSSLFFARLQEAWSGHRRPDADVVVRILLVGDSGVGKTSLVSSLLRTSLITQDESLVQSSFDEVNQVGAQTVLDESTVGVRVAVARWARRTAPARPLLVEFWDVGGHRNYADSRSIFYHKLNGVMFVHDLTNRKTLSRLPEWERELLLEDSRRKAKRQYLGSGVEEMFEEPSPGSGQRAGESSSLTRRSGAASGTSTGSPSKSSILNGLPVLVVGTKRDLVSPTTREEASSMSARARPTDWIARFDSVTTSGHQTSGGDAATPSLEDFDAFFERVALRRWGE